MNKRERKNARRQYRTARTRWTTAEIRLVKALDGVNESFDYYDNPGRPLKYADRKFTITTTQKLSDARAELRAAFKSYMTWTDKRVRAIDRETKARS